MSDIELRWYRYDDFEGLPEWEENPRVVTVLQWRRKEGPRGEDWWGEWENIPLVDVRLNAASSEEAK